MEKPKGIEEIIKSEPLKNYGLRFAGIGDEKICFETDGSTKKLIKVDINTFRQKIIQLLNNQDINTTLSNEEHRIDEYQEQEEVLTNIFGERHVLKKGAFRFNIPVTKEIADAVLGGEYKTLTDNFDENNQPEIEMLVETQFIADEINYPDAEHRGMTASSRVCRTS